MKGVAASSCSSTSWWPPYGVTTRKIRVKVDFRYVEIDHELWALGYMLSLIEPAITRFSEDGEAQILARLNDDGSEDDEAERQFAWQDIPTFKIMFFRGS